MVVAIRANIAVYFELRPFLPNLCIVFKYMTCRMIISASISQRFFLDLFIEDRDFRFDLLNALVIAEMAGLSLLWLIIFSPCDNVFRTPVAVAEEQGEEKGVVVKSKRNSKNKKRARDWPQPLKIGRYFDNAPTSNCLELPPNTE